MKQEKKTLTYVVFMEHKDLTLFKIGKSKDLKSRIRHHRSSNPFLGDFYTFNVDVEMYFKLCFKQYRIFEDSKREWFDFKLSKEQTLDIIKNAFIYLDEQILNNCCIENTAMEYQKYHLNSSDSVLNSCKVGYDVYQDIKFNRKNHKTQVKKIKDNLNNYRVHYKNTNKWIV